MSSHRQFVMVHPNLGAPFKESSFSSPLSRNEFVFCFVRNCRNQTYKSLTYSSLLMARRRWVLTTPSIKVAFGAVDYLIFQSDLRLSKNAR